MPTEVARSEHLIDVLGPDAQYPPSGGEYRQFAGCDPATQRPATDSGSLCGLGQGLISLQGHVDLLHTPIASDWPDSDNDGRATTILPTPFERFFCRSTQEFITLQ